MNETTVTKNGRTETTWEIGRYRVERVVRESGFVFLSLMVLSEDEKRCESVTTVYSGSDQYTIYQVRRGLIELALRLDGKRMVHLCANCDEVLPKDHPENDYVCPVCAEKEDEDE